MLTPKPQTMWGYYNFGRLHGVEFTRRGAIKAVEKHVMAPWKEARKFMEVRKVTVSPTSPTTERK